MNKELLEWAKRSSCQTDREAVDKLGELWGLQRKSGESDSDLKERVRACMEDLSNRSVQEYFESRHSEYVKYLQNKGE